MKLNELTNISSLNISHLIAFLELSSSLNYTKSAQKLHTSQPNLSKIIDKLESVLGVRLFTRDTRSVSLTKAGIQFRKDIYPLLNNLDQIIDDLRNLDLSENRELNVAVLASALIHHLPLISQEYTQLFPNTTLQLNDYDMTNLNECLKDPKYDIVFAPEIIVKNSPSKNQILFYSEAVCLVTNSSNPLSNLDTISLHDIKSLDIVLPSKALMPLDHQFIVQMLDSLNLQYNVVAEANTMMSLIMLIESGKGCSFLAKHMQNYYDNLTFIETKEFSNNFNMYCVWKNSQNPDVINFVNLINQYVKKWV